MAALSNVGLSSRFRSGGCWGLGWGHSIALNSNITVAKRDPVPVTILQQRDGMFAGDFPVVADFGYRSLGGLGEQVAKFLAQRVKGLL